LQYSPDLFILQLADDGIGFDVDLALENSALKDSTGISNIRKRARLINADVQIISRPDEGTAVTITIPSQP
jgi:signal transduction histidine kinase